MNSPTARAAAKNTITTPTGWCWRAFTTTESFINSCLLTCELQALAAGLKLLTSGVQDVYQSEFNDPYFEVTAELVGINQYLLYASFSMLVAEDRWQNFGTECFMTEEQLKALIGDIESEIRAFPEKL